MKTIAGKKALVTGAASGIGRSIATALAREGAELYLIDVNESALVDLAASLRRQGVRVVACACDLRDSCQVDEALDQLLREWGSVDIVVNNAGVAYYGPTAMMSDEQWDSVLAVNLLAPTQIVRRLLPALQQQRESHIVNICSIAGLVAVKRAAAYSLTKFALVGFTEALRSELGRYGIGVTAVCPGYVRTAIFRSTMNSGGERGARECSRWLSVSPDAVARRVVRAIRKNRPLVVITPLARALWLFKRAWPNLLPAFSGGLRRRAAAPQLATPETSQHRPHPLEGNASGRRRAHPAQDRLETTSHASK
jgi:short-subunit dehydrogenase